MDAALFFSTSSQAKSFLEFPVEVRNMIYDLTIYDHDRTAVFLLRAVPRNVTQSEDLDLQRAWVESDSGDEPEKCWAFPLVDGPSKASGEWLAPKPQRSSAQDDEDDADEAGEADEAAGAENSDEADNAEGADHEGSVDKANTHYDGQELDNAAIEGRCGGEDDDDHCSCLCHGELFIEQELPEALECPGAMDEEPCYWQCHEVPVEEEREAAEEGDGEDGEEGEVGEEDEQHDPDRYDKDCAVEEKDSDKEKHYLDLAADDKIQDDEDHFDSDERVGILYEAREPAILATCKDVRKECLPIYYCTNSFSWRFCGSTTRVLSIGSLDGPTRRPSVNTPS